MKVVVDNYVTAHCTWMLNMNSVMGCVRVLKLKTLGGAAVV
jgi:hypothetical protein